MLKLHSKIEALRTSLGSSPIRRSNPVRQPDVPKAKRSASDDPRLLKQYFCIWGVKDDWGTKPIKGCFSKAINERGPSSSAKYKIVALYMHNQSDSVGHPVILEEDEIGLYGEVPILEGIQVCDELVIRHKNEVCNNGSYGFNYVWDKMEYDDSDDSIVMKESDLFEVSFVTIGSQKGTYGVRGADGVFSDDFLTEETEDLMKKVPREHRLELRTIIDRHITLAKTQPLEIRQQALDNVKPQQGGIDYGYLINNLKL